MDSREDHKLLGASLAQYPGTWHGDRTNLEPEKYKIQPETWQEPSSGHNLHLCPLGLDPWTMGPAPGPQGPVHGQSPSQQGARGASFVLYYAGWCRPAETTHPISHLWLLGPPSIVSVSPGSYESVSHRSSSQHEFLSKLTFVRGRNPYSMCCWSPFFCGSTLKHCIFRINLNLLKMYTYSYKTNFIKLY